MKQTKTRKILSGLLGLASIVAPYTARAQEAPIVQNGTEQVEEKPKHQDGGEERPKHERPLSLHELHPRAAMEYDHKSWETTIHEPIDLGIKNPLTGESITWDRKHTEKTFSTQYKTTEGLGYGKDGGWNGEFFRMYNYWKTTDEGRSQWTEAAIKGKLTLGNVANEVILFGSFGDKEGYGFQSQHTLKDSQGRTAATLTLNAEKANMDEGRDPRRYGFDLDVELSREFPKVAIGGAFDRVETADDSIDYFLGRVRIQPRETDKLNFGYELKDSYAEGQTNAGIFVWTHLGKQEKWGTRTRIEGSDNRETDTSTGKLEVYLVQNPASGHAWGDAVTSRNNGDVRPRNVVGNALDIELPTTAGRSSKGFATRFLVDYTSVEDADALKVRGEVGYTWDLGDKKKFSVMPYAEHVTTLDDESGNGYGVDFNFSRPDMFLQLRVGKSEIGDKDETNAYFYFGKTFYFGNGGK